MKSASIGLPAVSRSSPAERSRNCAGFTLLEALMALLLLLAIASVMGPFLFQTRRIVFGAEPRLAAQVLLRSLLDAPFDRKGLATQLRQGEAGSLRWRVVTDPFVMTDGVETGPPTDWVMFRVKVTVSWGPEQAVSADTLRLGRMR
jgi:type II secretory pathway pseudopilin PulG